MQARNARGRERAYKLADSGGLYLFVATTGSRSWQLNYRFGGVQHTLTFGLYPEIGLAEARSRRDEARSILSSGATEIGVEPARTELGGGERQRHIVLTGHFAGADPRGADLDAAA